jgi:Family of unknown function (DUF6922)
MHTHSSDRKSTRLLPSDPLSLPEMMRPFFWDCDFSRISWQEDRDFIISRILSHGTWEAVQWVRGTVGDKFLRDYLVAHRGKGLSPCQLRFWELILRLSHRAVSAWFRDAGRTVWDRRITQ